MSAARVAAPAPSWGRLDRACDPSIQVSFEIGAPDGRFQPQPGRGRASGHVQGGLHSGNAPKRYIHQNGRGGLLRHPPNDPSPCRIGIIGTRGIPARYGGFETLAEELSVRLVERGHEVWVYARPHSIGVLPGGPRSGLANYRGVVVRTVPVPASKHAETLVHTLLSAFDCLRHGLNRVLVCNTANAIAVGILRRRGVHVVVNVDGLEWRRSKWGKAASAWHRWGAKRCSQWASNLVADSRFIQTEWDKRFNRKPAYVPYGAPEGPVSSRQKLRELGLVRRGYVLWVGRVEPENNPDVVIRAFRHVRSSLKLVLVGDAKYARGLLRRLRSLAAEDSRVVLAGGIYGKGYAELQSHAYCYVQASDVGGTHPALLDALGYGGCVIVNDIPEHREVGDGAALIYAFNDPLSLSSQIQRLVDQPRQAELLRRRARASLDPCYDWELVAAEYERLLCGSKADRDC